MIYAAKYSKVISANVLSVPFDTEKTAVCTLFIRLAEKSSANISGSK